MIRFEGVGDLAFLRYLTNARVIHNGVLLNSGYWSAIELVRLGRA